MHRTRAHFAQRQIYVPNLAKRLFIKKHTSNTEVLLAFSLCSLLLLLLRQSEITLLDVRGRSSMQKIKTSRRELIEIYDAVSASSTTMCIISTATKLHRRRLVGWLVLLCFSAFFRWLVERGLFSCCLRWSLRNWKLCFCDTPLTIVFISFSPPSRRLIFYSSPNNNGQVHSPHRKIAFVMWCRSAQLQRSISCCVFATLEPREKEKKSFEIAHMSDEIFAIHFNYRLQRSVDDCIHTFEPFCTFR